MMLHLLVATVKKKNKEERGTWPAEWIYIFLKCLDWIVERLKFSAISAE